MPDTIAYLLLGSNTAPEANLAQAVSLLRQQCRVLVVSRRYRTAAQGSGSGEYVNVAVKIATPLSPVEFKLGVLRPIEAQLGRRRTPELRAVVPIDLDIALWGETSITYGDKPWRAPSPDIALYAYAAVPLAELAPGYTDPETGETLAAIARRLSDQPIEKLGPIRRRGINC